MTAITRPKIASTTVSAMKRTRRKRTLARGVIRRPATSPIDWPRFRRLTTNDPKSWTAPMKIEPSTTQRSAGSQPQKTAIAGPTIGPVPAIEVK